MTTTPRGPGDGDTDAIPPAAPEPEAEAESTAAGRAAAAIAAAVGRGPMPGYSRAWSFDPYHQGLSLARTLAPEQVSVDTEWQPWEVFQQERRGEHHRHVGTVHAPDADVAIVMAKESFARRGACVNLWVTPAASVFATDYADADLFEHTTDKSYREPAGYQGLRRGKIQAQAGSGPDDHADE